MKRRARSVARGAAGTVVAALAAMALACSGSNKAPLIVYSPHGRDLLSAFEGRFEKAHPDVDVQWVDMGSQEVLDRVRSERANPQADVWFGGPAALFERAGADSLLAPYRPSWADAVRPEARGAGDLYFGVYLTPVVIAYNSDALTPEEAPHDWDDVLAPRWKGKILIRDPLASGTMRTIFGMIMYRGLQATGDTAAGYDWLRRLDRQTKEYVLNPALLYQKLARQEGLVTLWDMPDILTVRAKGFPIDYVVPASGTPVLVDPIAVVRGAPHPELAHEFVEDVGSVAAQLMAARRFYRIPARTDLPEDSLPDWLRRVEREMKPMPIDWGLLEARGNEWMGYWDAHIRSSG